MKIIYAMIKKSGKEVEGQISLPLKEQFVYRCLKEAVNKEELLVYSLVDILAKMQGYEKGRFIRFQEEGESS
ncbi:MAG: hypothetical protein IJ043_01445 [Clostridia bacterium]|nr:hypothetical protein [Clostridia bacterium]